VRKREWVLPPVEKAERFHDCHLIINQGFKDAMNRIVHTHTYLASESHGIVGPVPRAAAGIDEAVGLVRAAGVVAQIVFHLEDKEETEGGERQRTMRVGRDVRSFSFRFPGAQGYVQRSSTPPPNPIFYQVYFTHLEESRRVVISTMAGGERGCRDGEALACAKDLADAIV